MVQPAAIAGEPPAPPPVPAEEVKVAVKTEEPPQPPPVPEFNPLNPPKPPDVPVDDPNAPAVVTERRGKSGTRRAKDGTLRSVSVVATEPASASGVRDREPSRDRPQRRTRAEELANQEPPNRRRVSENEG